MTIKDKDNNISSMTENNTNLKKENSNLISENTNLKNELKKLNKKYEDLKSNYDKMISKNENINNNLNLSTKKISELNSKILSNETTIDVYKNQVDSLNKQIQKNNFDYDNNLKDYNNKITELTLENDKFKTLLEENSLSKITSHDYLTYNTKLAIKNCLISSKRLIENTQQSYNDNEREYKKFLKNVEELGQDLEICFQTFSRFDNGQRELIEMNNKYNRLYKEMMSYRNDNKKLYDNYVQLYNIHELLKNESDYLLKCLKEYLTLYINKKEISESLLRIIDYEINLIYYKNDLNKLNQRIENIKNYMTNDDIDSIMLLRNLEIDKDNLEKNINSMINNKNELEKKVKEEKIDDMNII